MRQGPVPVQFPDRVFKDRCPVTSKNMVPSVFVNLVLVFRSALGAIAGTVPILTGRSTHLMTSVGGSNLSRDSRPPEQKSIPIKRQRVQHVPALGHCRIGMR